MSERAPCVKCGMLLHTGEGRVIVAFSADELEAVAVSVPDESVARRMICALGLLDSDRADAVAIERAAITEAMRGG